ncbi:MAG: hypothetical protein PHE49_00865 [bacterium]|nr:hypothetical protein [bacterium]
MKRLYLGMFLTIGIETFFFTSYGIQNRNPECLTIRHNPFIQKTVIRYSLIGTRNNYKIDNSKLMIYDVSGNKIMELVPEYSKNENSYSALLPNNKKMSTGIYFLRIGNFIPIKLIKLK